MPNLLTQRKWREAHFFCNKLSALDGDPNLARAEEFGFLASAFLSAARSVVDVACKENPKVFAKVFEIWKASLDPEIRAMYEFVSMQRVRAVHFGESSSQQSHVVRPALHVQSSMVAPWAFDQDATVEVSVYSIWLNGEDRSARDLFSRYLESLALFVAKLEA
ncbi:MAG: hypothetical protein ACREA9_01445 [Pyrinomonadaceae bacterium]